jgi:CelD/BcsL family acetyltransferase involved in cellulose biosynthesis
MQRLSPVLANPFLSSQFATAVSGFRPTARVAILYDGQAIAGFFPFEKRRWDVGVPICGWPGTPCHGLVHAPGLDWDPRELLRACRLAAWQFDHLIAEQKPFVPYHAALEPSPVMDLSDGFAAYLRARSSRLRRVIANQAGNLARDFGELRFVANADDTAILCDLMTWKSEQYRRIGAVDIFARSWFADLLDSLRALRGSHVTSIMSALYAGDRRIAAQFGLRSGDLFVGWLTAYDPRFAKYSPGHVQLIRMAEELAADGVAVIDLGKGADAFKERLKSRDTFLAEGIVTGRSVLAAAHRVGNASARWAVRTSLRHPRLFRATRRIRSALR